MIEMQVFRSHDYTIDPQSGRMVPVYRRPSPGVEADPFETDDQTRKPTERIIQREAGERERHQRLRLIA